MLGEDNFQGLKHGFLTGMKVYYKFRRVAYGSLGLEEMVESPKPQGCFGGLTSWWQNMK